jgi:predicted lipid-binding transport protein (Tim44 family)
MGLIKKLLGGIFGLIKGIFGFLGGLLGIGKSSEYYVELDNAKDGGASKSSPSAQSSQASAEVAQSQPSANAKAQLAQTEPAPASAPVATASSSSQSSWPSVQPTPPGMTFAPNFRVSLSSQNGRRRPGPSMKSYRDMAKQMMSGRRS